MNKYKNNGTPRLEGNWPVLVTPYQENLKIDIGAYRRIIKWHINMDLGGIYANCLSSEMYQLNNKERLLLIREAVQTVQGRVPIAATGNFGDSFEKQLEFCRKVYDQGVDVVMLTVPHNLKTDNELEMFFMEMAEQTTIPLGIYECPYPFPHLMSLSLIKKLANTGRFIAYKETSCNINKVKKIINVTKHTALAVLQANIPILVSSMTSGASGSMNVVSNWVPDLAVEVMKKGLTDHPDVPYLHSVLCAMDMLQRSIHPAGVKFLMQKRGLPIAPLTRYNHTLTSEEALGLEAIFKLWFDSKGALKLHYQVYS